MLTALNLFGGLVLLLAGGEVLLRASGRVALALGMPHALIALTVIAFGSSAPELVVSVEAAGTGFSGIVLGNVLGSNLANIGLVLALCALVRRLSVSRESLRLEMPLIVILHLVFLWVCLADRQVQRLEGMVLVVFGVLYVGSIIRRARKTRNQPSDVSRASLLLASMLTMLGLGALLVGAWLFLKGATSLGEAVGMSDAFVGLTVVALGTSLPELVTSLMAVARGNDAVAVGTIMGSCVFNLTFVMGTAATAFPLQLPAEGSRFLVFDLVAALTLSVLLVAVIGRRRNPALARGGGLLLLLFYLGVITFRSFWR